MGFGQLTARGIIIVKQVYSNAMDTPFCFQSRSNSIIAAKLRTWHHSCTVLTCAKYSRNWRPTPESQQGHFIVQFFVGETVPFVN